MDLFLDQIVIALSAVFCFEVCKQCRRLCGFKVEFALHNYYCFTHCPSCGYDMEFVVTNAVVMVPCVTTLTPT